ncbi:unnamed protein product [Echinostoma caproni]|uniref:Peptidase A2 domain-containing protein n=1 Tax=Echinostoma caproni TaxID=27848 RepID=A0A183AXC5_9TREM|nr:unnamed protein product [Echinostoma caproni]
MRQLLSTRVLDDAILPQLWFKRLLPRIREVLSVLSNSSLDEMSMTADKMFEANPALQHITACSNPTRCTGIRFLIDTGAELSVIPRRIHYRHLQPTAVTLQAANSSRIHTYGRRSIAVDLG